MLHVAQTRNVQIVVESHSEHLLRRFQRRVAEGSAEPDDVKLYFVSARNGVARASDLSLNRYGEVENWPAGFFGDEVGEVAAIAKAGLKKRIAEQSGWSPVVVDTNVGIAANGDAEGRRSRFSTGGASARWIRFDNSSTLPTGRHHPSVASGRASYCGWKRGFQDPSLPSTCAKAFGVVMCRTTSIGLGIGDLARSCDGDVPLGTAASARARRTRCTPCYRNNAANRPLQGEGSPVRCAAKLQRQRLARCQWPASAARLLAGARCPAPAPPPYGLVP